MNLKCYAFDIFTFVKGLIDMVSGNGRIPDAKNKTGKKEWGSLNEQT
jgi:hypothetical protein